MYSRVCVCVCISTLHIILYVLCFYYYEKHRLRIGQELGLDLVSVSFVAFFPRHTSNHNEQQQLIWHQQQQPARARLFYVAKCRTLLTALHRFSKFSCFKSFLLNLFHNFHKQFMLLKFIFTIYVINTIYKFTGQVLALTISIFWCRCGDVFYVICIVIDLSLVFW